MKGSARIGAAALVLLALTACGREAGPSQAQLEQTTQTVEAVEDMSREDLAPLEQIEYIRPVPEEYFGPSDHSGQVVEIAYDSRDYTDPAEPAIQKTAYVYLPYGYDEADRETRYDILYLMHGWTMTAGDLFDPAQSGIVPMLDHMIENGDIPPVIVVCATFDAQDRPQSFSRSVEELSVFHRDLREDLIPYVESRYHTYAEDVTEEGLQASRAHRAFGGFSLGAVTTWYQFIYGLDYIQYFLPMSGDCWIMGTYGGLYQPVETVDYLEQVVSDGGWSADDFYIYQGIGTDDPIWDQTDSQIQEMLTRDLFTADALHYAIIQDGRHDIDACERYLYHALPRFFGNSKEGAHVEFEPVTRNTLVRDVMDDPAFGDHGRLLFPVDRTIPENMTLEDVGDILIWYHYVDPEKTVEIVNTLGERAASGDTVFYDIYTDEEKAADPDKEDTGLFFFRGDPGGKTAICNAGGGFVYVGAMQDSFPHALELSKQGYNAFALIYRPGAQTACEDLARAIAFLHAHTEELGIDMTDYSLWGGSAGGRMAAWLGTYGTDAFGERTYPRPAAVIMQYTGLSEVMGDEPPTYCCVGTSDGIAPYRVMEERVRRIRANGTDAEIEVFQGLPHGFGLGEGTVAEGWIDHAIAFWERQMSQ